MVRLEEVEDEHFQQSQLGADDDEGDYSDTGMRGLCFVFALHLMLPQLQGRSRQQTEMHN